MTATCRSSSALARSSAACKGFLAAAFLGVNLSLAGCTVGPDYARPEITVPERIAEAPPGSSAPVWPTTDWWRGFGSAELAALMERAQSANYDIGAAVARVRQADAQTRIAGAALLPDVALSSSVARERLKSVSSDSNPRTLTAYNATLAASYELDFWGKNRASLASAQWLAEATRYDRETVALTVQADVATTYFQVLGDRDRLAVARENLATAERVLAIIRARDTAGTASGLQVSQQESVVAGLRASIPALEQRLQQNIYALGTLVGLPPEQIEVSTTTLDGIALPAVTAGLPSELLQRRPDVLTAESQLISANADITVARAQMFPSIALTAQGGFESAALSSLFGAGGAIYSLAVGLTQPIFSGGRIEGQIELSQARYDELVENYRKAVVSGFTDVEDSLVAFRQTTEQEALQRTAVDTAQRAYQFSEAQLRQGIVDLLTVLNTQQTLFQAQDTLVQVRTARATSLVALYRALGGGWEAHG
jgi:outer membrane protein, multidrug efflux system